MQEVIILAGPNGAGKTTFANEYLAFEERLTFVNADEIALDGSMLGLSGPKRDIRAARLMLQRMDSLVAARADFMFETTIASLTYARRIPIWRSLGYYVALL